MGHVAHGGLKVWICQFNAQGGGTHTLTTALVSYSRVAYFQGQMSKNVNTTANKNEALNQCIFIVGPPSKTLIHH